jgi:hypothetical protein
MKYPEIEPYMVANHLPTCTQVLFDELGYLLGVQDAG